jgi:septation ring formation regulator EzrA
MSEEQIKQIQSDVNYLKTCVKQNREGCVKNNVDSDRRYHELHTRVFNLEQTLQAIKAALIK